MRLKLVIAGLLASSIAFAGTDAKTATSVTVLNLSDELVDLWMNGEYRVLGASSGLQYPCLPGEKVEVQVGMTLDYLACGEKREIIQ